MYASRSDLDALLSAPTVVECLDDNEDGTEDAGLFTTLATMAEAKVNSYLEGRYGSQMPWANPPALCRQAALYFLAESLFTRRPGAEAPPKIAKEAKSLRDRLELIQEGKTNLSAVQAEGDVIVASGMPSGAQSTSGGLLS